VDLKQARLVTTNKWFRMFMPYTFTRLHGAKRPLTFLPLNRNYKPLGVCSRDWVKYADYESQAMVFAVDPRKFKGVWETIRIDDLWLYSDGPKSRVDYFERLAKLFTYKIGVDSPSSRE
jgi:hypothetical protein